MHIDRDRELEQKRNRIEAAFHDVDIDALIDSPVHAAKRSSYRNRHRMAVTDGIVHFFNQVKSSGCLVLRSELWNALQQLRSISKSNPDFLRHVSHLEVRVSDEPDIVGLRLNVNQKYSMPHIESHSWEELQIALGDNWRIADQDNEIQPTLSYDLGNAVTTQVPLNAFVQVNSVVNRLLLYHIVDVAKQYNFRTFLDLYAGAGNLSLPLLNTGMAGTAIEKTTAATQTLAEHQLARNLNIVSGDVHASLESLHAADLVLCNPPRSGIKQGYSTIASLASNMLLLVSCDPDTLANDIAHLLPYGFAVAQLTPFDMFPGTTHIETVAVLTR